MDRTRATEPRDETQARVVVGYDGSDSAQAAVVWAADEAARRGVELGVVYAADYTGLIGGAFGDAWLPESALRAAGDFVETGVRLARGRQPSLEVWPAVHAGGPVQALIDESIGSGLVVMGARGRGEFAALALGSVSTAVVAHAHAPVVVVRGGEAVRPSPDRPVVVGVDGSAATEAALRFAVDAARAGGATLKIVGAWPTLREDWVRAYWLAADPTADPDRVARESAEVIVAEAADRAAELGPDVKVQTYVRGGHAAGVIVDLAGDDAALIVLGSRGRGSATGLLFGSVSHGVVHAARCPVAVLNHQTSPGAAAPLGRATSGATG